MPALTEQQQNLQNLYDSLVATKNAYKATIDSLSPIPENSVIKGARVEFFLATGEFNESLRTFSLFPFHHCHRLRRGHDSNALEFPTQAVQVFVA